MEELTPRPQRTLAARAASGTSIPNCSHKTDWTVISSSTGKGVTVAEPDPRVKMAGGRNMLGVPNAATRPDGRSSETVTGADKVSHPSDPLPTTRIVTEETREGPQTRQARQVTTGLLHPVSNLNTRIIEIAPLTDIYPRTGLRTHPKPFLKLPWPIGKPRHSRWQSSTVLPLPGIRPLSAPCKTWQPLDPLPSNAHFHHPRPLYNRTSGKCWSAEKCSTTQPKDAG